MPERRQYPAFYLLDGVLHFALVPRLPDARGEDGGAVVAGQLLVGGVHVRLVVTGRRDARFEIVRHQERGYPAEVGEGPHVGADPIGQRLALRGFRVGVARSAEGGHEDLNGAALARGAVYDRDRQARVIDEELLPGHMHLMHARLRRPPPCLVELAEAAVAERLGVRGPVLFPEQQQRHTLLAQLPVDIRPVRQRALRGGDRLRRGKEAPFQLGVGQVGGQRPGEPGTLGAA